MHPLSPPTHIWAIQHAAQTPTAHPFSNRKITTPTLVCRSGWSHSFSLSCTNEHTHTQVLGCVTSCRGRTTNMSLVLSGFCRARVQSTSFSGWHSSSATLSYILYGFYMDLFSLFSYSVPEVPWPRSPVSLMTVGEQSISCTPPNIAQHPLGAVDWILRGGKKTCFQKQKQNLPENPVSEGLNRSSCDSCERVCKAHGSLKPPRE